MSLDVYIGPNGFGKTTKLNNVRDDLIDSKGVPKNEIIFLNSEILLVDEMKDTRDESKTMEFIINEVLSTPALEIARQQYEEAVDNEINANVDRINKIIDDILSINNQDRNIKKGKSSESLKNFIETTEQKEYKKLVKINREIAEKKMGSGQKMQLILALIKESSKSYIFLDEPEKYSHPSLLHKTAKLIEEISKTKTVYMATHSPKLLSMIDLDISRIFIFNDNSYTPKVIDFVKVCNKYSSYAKKAGLKKKELTYFNETTLRDNIKKFHYRDFIEALFSKRVYLVEGINDILFINKMLRDNNLYYEDYKILPSYGKHRMMLFAELFESLDIEVHLYFDEDDVSHMIHSYTNTELCKFRHYYIFKENLEDDLKFIGDKSNQIDFSNHLESIIIDSKYICS
ncbi:MAG: hypothetical protein BWY30_00798 [Tenericutes bacterium ADurb.Bin239]|jgi:predicted ATP-dependent endonuclease of OLD family|nr:MAG: hypothetical protein BWY30_00798 [Tenericutes bacterium ADurb.Bin239]